MERAKGIEPSSQPWQAGKPKHYINRILRRRYCRSHKTKNKQTVHILTKQPYKWHKLHDRRIVLYYTTTP